MEHPYKMKQVCERTGLTEKAVRLYVSEGLVQPEVTRTLHTNTYAFSEKNIQALKDIAALRNAGFGLADIKQMQRDPAVVPQLVEERKNLLAEELQEKQAVQDALSRLSPSAQGSPETLAKAVEGVNRHPEEPSGFPKGLVRGIVLVLLAAALVWINLPSSFRSPIWGPSLIKIKFAFSVGFSILLPIAAVTAWVMAVRYATTAHRAAKLPNRAKGTILSVSRDASFDISYVRHGNTADYPARSSSVNALLFMSLWNELRPDHYYPVIRFTDSAGVSRTGTLLYGGLKGNFQEGAQVEVAWKGNAYDQMLPLHAPWLVGKGLAYGLLGAVLLVLTAWTWSGVNQLMVL